MAIIEYYTLTLRIRAHFEGHVVPGHVVPQHCPLEHKPTILPVLPHVTFLCQTPGL